MIPDTQSGQDAEVEIKHRSVMATTSDSPDNSIESRKKRTGIKIIVDPVACFDGYELSALPCKAGHFEGCKMSLDQMQNSLLVRQLIQYIREVF
jgi:hypothetical protein